MVEFVSVRDFRIRPGKIWKKLKKSKRMLVTSHGKPFAMLTDIDSNDLEGELKADIIAKGILTLSKIREFSKDKELDKLTEADISQEIKNARKTF